MNVLRLILACSCALLVACGGASTRSKTAASSAEQQAANVWRSKCGSCHVPVKPGSHPRDELETVLRRHRKRVRLSDDQWAELVNFLAPPKQQATLQ